MNDSNYLGSDVPEMSHTFTVDVEGSISKKRYVGEFTCEIPNTKTQCLIAKHRAMLNGPNAGWLDPGTLKVHMHIAYLRYTLTDYPTSWWKKTDLGYDLMDHNVIEEVYNKVMEFEKQWLKQVWGEEYEERFEDEEEENEQPTVEPKKAEKAEGSVSEA